MQKIKILPEILSNKIAAGEVVQRPASIVKELIENSLDAKSSKITIKIEQGGKSLIQISDNGTGMGKDDALLSLERYATSKIYSDNDLFSISTLGFRGEALPSIASVSKFTLTTKDSNSNAGTKIEVQGGKIKNVTDTGAPKGTMISVNNLFYNTPARKKFLKTVNTEAGHIFETMAATALAWPEVQFELYHNNRLIYHWQKTKNLSDRIIAVLSINSINNFIKIKHLHGDINISGYISMPNLTRNTTNKIYIYANKRPVKDRGIKHALIKAYGTRLMKSTFPMAVLFINTAKDKIDVNVHPSKQEVRFSDFKNVYTAVSNAVAAGWRRLNSESSLLKRDDLFPKDKETEEFALNNIIPNRDIRDNKPEEQRINLYSKNTSCNNNDLNIDNTPISSVTDYFGPRKKQKPSYENIQFQKTEIKNKQSILWKKADLLNLKIIGQFKNSYIICEDNRGIVIIDQHAAHERILYEKIVTRMKSAKLPAQRLLFAQTIHLNFTEAKIMEKLLPQLNKIGLETKHFGGNSFIIRSVPAIIPNCKAEPLVMEIIESYKQFETANCFNTIFDNCIKIMACHGAIRSGDSLKEPEIRALLNDLEKCENPMNCPHGRPTTIKWETINIEKSFKRIV